MNLFNQISTWPTLHARHEAAPWHREREQYLTSMLKRGVSRTTVRTTATLPWYDCWLLALMGRLLASSWNLQFWRFVIKLIDLIQEVLNYFDGEPDVLSAESPW